MLIIFDAGLDLPSKCDFIFGSIVIKSLDMSLHPQLTTSENLAPGDHVLQVMNETEDDLLHYKPSTPIGKR